MRYLGKTGYTSMPWRNGKGVTLEIARVPAPPAEFDWRLSLASLDNDGPFSSYPTYQRVVVLVEGAGFTLDFADGSSQRLAEPGAAAVFQGDAEVACRLHDGPCRDLSLMVRAPGTVLAVQLLDPTQRFSLPAAVGAQRAVFGLAGQSELVRNDLTGPADNAVTLLATGDCILLEETDGEAALAPTGAGSRALLLEWTHFQSRTQRAHAP